MENGNQRVLAYLLARTLSHEDLDNVSGGSGGMHFTNSNTAHATGDSAQGPDGALDVKLDW